MAAPQALRTQDTGEHVLVFSSLSPLVPDALRFQPVDSGEQALRFLERGHPVSVILTPDSGPDGPWHTLVEKLTPFEIKPELIVVASALEPELWAEVLLRGGFDTVPASASPDIIEQSVVAAIERYRRRREIAEARRRATQFLFSAAPSWSHDP